MIRHLLTLLLLVASTPAATNPIVNGRYLVNASGGTLTNGTHHGTTTATNLVGNVVPVYNAAVPPWSVPMDGSADGASALQTLVDFVKATGGGEIVITGRVAIGTSGILLNGATNITISGRGPNPGFKALATTTLDIPFTATVGAIIGITNSSKITITGLYFDGNSTVNKAIGIEGSTYTTIENNEFTAFTTGSSTARAVIMSFGGNHNRYLRNTIHDTTGADLRGIWTGNTNAGEQEGDPLIDGNHIYNSAHTAIGGTMHSARIVNNSINLAGFTNGGCIKYGSYSAEQSKQSLIANNICIGGNAGIQGDGSGADFSMGVLVTGNICASNNTWGILLVNVSDWIVTDNVVKNNNLGGLGTFAGGIFTLDCKRMLIANNNCRDDRTGGSRTQKTGITVIAQSQTCDGISILNNICENNTEYGIVVNSVGTNITNMLIAGNNCVSNTLRGLAVSDTNPGEITGLVVGQNMYQGNGVAEIQIDSSIIPLSADSLVGFTGNDVTALGLSKHPYGIYVPLTATNTYLYATNTFVRHFFGVEGGNWGFFKSAFGWHNTGQGFSFGQSTAPVGGLVEIFRSSGAAQLRLSQSSTSYTDFFQASAQSNLTVAPSGGNFRIQGLTVSRALGTDANTNLVSLTATTAEVNRLSGVTTNIITTDAEIVAQLVTKVTGPGSATDEAIARFDGTTGKLIQNTAAVTLSDTGAFTLPDNVRQTFNPGANNAGINVGSHAGNPSSPSVGDIWFNSNASTYFGYTDIGSPGGNKTVNIGPVPKYVQLLLASAKLSGATLDTSETNDRILFDAAADETATWQLYMPDDFNPAIYPRVRLIWSMASATAGACSWDAQVMAVSPGDAADVNTESYAAAQGATTINVPATAGHLATQTYIYLGTNDSLAPGDYVKIRLFRDADNGLDTATGDAELIAVALEYYP